MKRKPALCIALFTILVLGMLALLLNQSHSINISGDMIVWQTNSDEVSTQTVCIQGKYKQGCFSNSKFDGTISIEDITDAKDYDETYFTFRDTGYASINTVNIENGRPETRYIGDIVINEDFTKLSIFLTATESGGWSSEDVTIISYPATTRSQAVEDTIELCETNWLSDVIWK